MLALQLQDKKIIVIGGGVSGQAVCRFLLDKGAQVTLADSKSAAQLAPELVALTAEGLSLLLEDALPQTVDWQLAVKSPGVPHTTPLMKLLHDSGLPIIGDLELAYRFSEAPFIAVTGTNGKTTTTELLYKIFCDAGIKTLMGGNIGQPLIGLVEGHKGAIVAEVSSFQAEDCQYFAPKVGLFLNLSPDHLDRHGDMAGYLAAKEKIFHNQSESDFAILNYDDEAVRQVGKRLKSQVIYFSRQKQLTQGVFCQNGQIVMALGEKKINLLPAEDIYIKGGHNLENALAAAVAAFVFGIEPPAIAAGLRAFRGVEHRLETVAEIEGVLYINDSKGTNPDSTIKALLAYERPIILVAGGRNKDNDFSALMRTAKGRVVFFSFLGEAKEELAAAARAAGFTDKDFMLCDSFEEAFFKAQAQAEAGDIVMLSPACASWDMFKNFEARGKVFKDLVLAGK
jgi:UDP-N-acetylmuramoylalanine--D-glutamate ligase